MSIVGLGVERRTPHGGPRVKLVVFAAMLVCAACAVPPPGGEVRRQRLESEHRSLISQLEDLQARLLVNAERVRFWEQMRERHESVSAIACTSLETHAIAIAERLEHEQGTAQGPVGRRQARVASIRQASEVTAARRR